MPLSTYLGIFKHQHAAVNAEAPVPSTTVNVPRRHWGLWDVQTVAVTDANRATLQQELEQASATLSGRIDSSDNTILYAQAAGAAVIGILQIVKAGVNRLNGTQEAANTGTNVIIDSICLCIPVLTTFISAVAKVTRDNALQYQSEAQQSTTSIQPAGMNMV
jgi:heme/copper-type cytochrome/quinol oxidase subunit 2